METRSTNITDKEMILTRIFNAPKQRVWDVWTKPEEIMKWWGPEGFSCPAAVSDFTVGGKYNYCMKAPVNEQFQGQEMWSGGVFKEIVPGERIVYTDYFTDEQGNMKDPADFGMPAHFPKENTATITFEDIGEGKTKLSIISHLPEDAAGREAIIKSGAPEGWHSSLDKLEKVL